VSGPIRKGIRMTLFFILFPTITTLCLVLPYFILEISIAGGIVILLAFLLTVSCCVGFLLKTSYTDPGIIPRATPSPHQLNLEKEMNFSNLEGSGYTTVTVDDVILKLRYCITCHQFRQPRAVHCGTCDNCVEEFDHHCFWTSNCVGKNNYKSFFAFLNLTMLTIVFATSLSIAQITSSVQNNQNANPFFDSLIQPPPKKYCHEFVFGVLRLGGALQIIQFVHSTPPRRHHKRNDQRELETTFSEETKSIRPRRQK